MYIDQATYWAAQSAARAGNETQAERLLASLRDNSLISYYGMLAREQSGAGTEWTGRPGPVTDSLTAARVASALDRWAVLRDVDWNEAAALELNRIKGHFEADRAALYELAEQLHRREAPHLAIRLGRELAGGQPLDTRLLRILYPMPSTIGRGVARARSASCR
jgi:hypothetical protein